MRSALGHLAGVSVREQIHLCARMEEPFADWVAVCSAAAGQGEIAQSGLALLRRTKA